MNKTLGALLVVLGAIWFFRILFSPVVILLIIAAALALGAASGAIGRWGYAAAVVFAGLAVPALFFGAVTMVLRLLRFAPFLVIVLGVILIMRAFDKK